MWVGDTHIFVFVGVRNAKYGDEARPADDNNQHEYGRKYGKIFVFPVALHRSAGLRRFKVDFHVLWIPALTLNTVLCLAAAPKAAGVQVRIANTITIFYG